MMVRNELMAPELTRAGAFERPAGKQAAMNQQLPSWRTAKGQGLWLSALIGAMEKFSRPEWRARPVDQLELAAVRNRLAQPAMAYPAYASRFSLRN